MNRISFTVALKTGNGLNDRAHWGTRSKKVKKERSVIAMAWLVFAGRGPRLEPPVKARLTRIKPAGKMMDDDNLKGSLKAVRDQVAEQIGVDDRDKTKIVFDYDEQYGPWGVRIEVEELPF